MKGEYLEHQDDNHNHNHNAHSHQHQHHQHQQQNIFSKFPPPHLQHPNSYPSHPFQLPPKLTSEEPSSPTPTTTPTPPSKKPKTTTSGGEDGGGTVEVSRRPRGRPPGSKNKPKPPIVITREPEPGSMSPYILELPSGSDIPESLTRFTRRRNVGLCILTASGAVANVTLKQPSTSAPSGTVTFHGRFDILSLSAVIMVSNGNNGEGQGGGFGFTISLAGPQGQIVGGKVVGPLLASGTVYVIAASFNGPSFHRLPVAVEEQQQPVSGGDGRSSSPVSGGDGGGGGGGGGGAMGMYSCHVVGTTTSSSTDVIWAPTARQPPY